MSKALWRWNLKVRQKSQGLLCNQT